MHDPEMLANLAAEEARRKAYIDTLKLAYETQIQEIMADSAEKIKSMQEQIESTESVKEAACVDAANRAGGTIRVWLTSRRQ